jgi:hypothetical protein
VANFTEVTAFTEVANFTEVTTFTEVANFTDFFETFLNRFFRFTRHIA